MYFRELFIGSKDKATVDEFFKSAEECDRELGEFLLKMLERSDKSPSSLKHKYR